MTDCDFVQPLPGRIVKLCEALGVKSFTLSFSGGSDEGYLDISIVGLDEKWRDNVHSEIETWAWDVYAYGGAGGGSDYGDDVTYDLVKKTVTHSGWSTERVEHSGESKKLKIARE